MGYSSWSDRDWSSYSSKKISGKRVEEIYTSSTIDAALNPFGIKLRESRDSVEHPISNSIIVGLDVTGSMSSVLHEMAKGLNTLVTEIYDRKPVSDPQILCCGIGDVECDSSPFQPTQFETGIEIAEQLTKIYLERGGGGNNYESYTLAWYFAGMMTSIDCFEKRGKKGYLFTIGDECPTKILRAKDIVKVFGHGPENDLSPEELLTLASRQYEVFHIMVEEGSYFRRSGDRVVQEWSDLLGQNAIRLADHTKLSETIVSLIQANEGVDHDTIVKSWDGSTSLTVARAIKDLKKGATAEGDVVLF